MNKSLQKTEKLKVLTKKFKSKAFPIKTVDALSGSSTGDIQVLYKYFDFLRNLFWLKNLPHTLY